MTSTQSTRGASRARGNRGRGGSNRGANRGTRGNAKPFEPAERKEAEAEKIAENAVAAAPAADDDDDDTDVCWICAEPVKYYGLPECNHRTCHVCALRLRALYKKMDCTFCKVSKALDTCYRINIVARNRKHL